MATKQGENKDISEPSTIHETETDETADLTHEEIKKRNREQAKKDAFRQMDIDQQRKDKERNEQYDTHGNKRRPIIELPNPAHSVKQGTKTVQKHVKKTTQSMEAQIRKIKRKEGETHALLDASGNKIALHDAPKGGKWEPKHDTNGKITHYEHESGIRTENTKGLLHPMPDPDWKNAHINKRVEEHNQAVLRGDHDVASNIFNEIADSVGLDSVKGKEATEFFRQMIRKDPDKALTIIVNMITKRITAHGLGLIVIIEIMTGIVSLMIEIIPIPGIGVFATVVDAFGESLTNTITALGPDNLTMSFEQALQRIGPTLQPLFKEAANIAEQVFGSIGCCDKNIGPEKEEKLKQNIQLVTTVLADKVLPILYNPKLANNKNAQQAAAKEIKDIINSTIEQISEKKRSDATPDSKKAKQGEQGKDNKTKRLPAGTKHGGFKRKRKTRRKKTHLRKTHLRKTQSKKD